MARSRGISGNVSGCSLGSLLRSSTSICKVVIREEGGARWEDQILRELQGRVSEIDARGGVRTESGAGRLAYLVTTCRNTTRATVARKSGLFQRAVEGDRLAAEGLLMLFWRDIEKAVARGRAAEFDAEVVARVAKGFVKAVTSERTEFRAKSPDVLPKLVRVICRRAIATVLQEHGLCGEHPVRYVPLEERQTDAEDGGGTPAARGDTDTNVSPPKIKGDGGEGPDQGSCPAAMADGVLGFLDGYVPIGETVLQRELCALLARMPENHRNAVLLRAYLPDWSIGDLCRGFLGGMKPALYRTWLKRGRDHLRAKVEERLRTIIPEDVADPVEARELRRLCKAMGIEAQHAI
ncbi:MAG: hypothetical protein AB2L07_15785 [Thermoanaerobaculaceae bacterium]